MAAMRVRTSEVETHHEAPKVRQVLDCASPLALWLEQSGRVESARGLAQSKTLPGRHWFMGSKRELSVGGILTPARGEGERESALTNDRGFSIRRRLFAAAPSPHGRGRG